MPTYQFKCTKHDTMTDVKLAIEERDKPECHPRCPICDVKMKRAYTTFGVRGLPTTN